MFLMVRGTPQGDRAGEVGDIGDVGEVGGRGLLAVRPGCSDVV